MADKEKNYYDLKTDAVDRLVNANEQNSPEVSDKEIEKISGRKRWSIPNIVKVLLIKWWFSGAICFFFYFGLGTYLKTTVDQLFVLGAAMGVLTDLLTNHMLTFIEKTERANDRYKMVTVRKFWSMFLNIPYAFVILACVVYLYNVINVIVVRSKGLEDAVALPVEPVLFGLFWMGFDMLFIGMKRLLIKIFRDAEQKARGNR